MFVMDNFDFGFSAMSEEELKKTENELKTQVTTTTENLSASQDKLVKLVGMIVPFLNKLKEHPDKSFIYWPNRTEKIDQFVQMIKEVTK